jgi:hypothetical protein
MAASDCQSGTNTGMKHCGLVTNDLQFFLMQVYSIFVLLGLGAGIAVCFAIGECLYFRHVFHHVHSRRQLHRSRSQARRLMFRQQLEESQRQKQYEPSEVSLDTMKSAAHGDFGNGSLPGAASGELSSAGFAAEESGVGAGLGVSSGDGEKQQEGGLWRSRDPQAEIGSASSVELTKGGAQATPRAGGVESAAIREECKDVEAAVGQETSQVYGNGASTVAGTVGVEGCVGLGVDRVTAAQVGAAGGTGPVMVSRPWRWYDLSTWYNSGHGGKEQ